MLWPANHCFCPCCHRNCPCMTFYYQFHNNNIDINTIDHSVLMYFHFESHPKPRKISHFDFTMATVLLIFALINRPLIFISCLCTIIGAFNSLYHWCKRHFSKSCIKSTATQTLQSSRMLSFDVSCHLEVINEVSLHFFFNLFFSCFHSYISIMALGFPKMQLDFHEWHIVYIKSMSYCLDKPLDKC